MRPADPTRPVAQLLRQSIGERDRISHPRAVLAGELSPKRPRGGHSVPAEPSERRPHLHRHPPSRLRDLARKTTHPSEIRGAVNGGDDRLNVLLPRRVQGQQRTRLVLARSPQRGDRGGVFPHPSAQRAVTFQDRTRGLIERDRDQLAQVGQPLGERARSF